MIIATMEMNKGPVFYAGPFFNANFDHSVLFDRGKLRQ